MVAPPIRRGPPPGNWAKDSRARRALPAVVTFLFEASTTTFLAALRCSFYFPARHMSEVLVIGHRNPDTDAICSAIGYAEFKRRVESLPEPPPAPVRQR